MFRRSLLLFFALMFFSFASSRAFAQSDPAMEALQKRMQALEETNKALMLRIEELEKRSAPSEGGVVSKEQPCPISKEIVEKNPAPEAKSDVKSAEPELKKPLEAYWDKGLNFESSDGRFHLKVGGRVMFDVATFDCPEYWVIGGDEINEHDGSEFRRLRLRMSGEVYEDFLYKLEVDFADNDAEIIDAYVGVRNLPVAGTLRVGQFSEPFGLEALTSSSDISFMERSMATQALIPYRSRGIAINNAFFEQRMTASVGVFNGGLEQDNYWSVTGRVTAAPWFADDGRRLLHVGASASHRNPEGEYSFAARPGSHLADEHLDTGALPMDEATILGAEGALVLGPFSLQGEYARADVCFMPEQRDVTFLGLDEEFKLDDRSFDGWYVQASYFLTGENRVYNLADGAFGRVIPKRPFKLRGGGLGAWELALRYEKLALDDYDIVGGVVGGRARNFTVGVNWHMTANARLMLNYVRSDVEQFTYDGDIGIVEARFQADF